MGLLFAETSGEFQAKSETKLLQQLGCKACPLNHTPGKIDATGSKEPEIYILGEAAGREEEEQRKQFVGKAGKMLRKYLPKDALPLIRWDNILQCHPPRNRTPERQEIECCRPRVAGGVAKYQPTVIWGFGNVPLRWVSGFDGIKLWRGRRMPVKINDHDCWYYPFFHPSWLERIYRESDRSEFGSEDERMTMLDIERAWADFNEGLPKPIVHTTEMVKANVTLVKDIRGIEQALQWAARQPGVGYDYETLGKRPYEGGAKILSAAVGTLKQAFAFPVEHDGAGFTSVQKKAVHELIKRFLMSAPCVKYVHNLVFEQEWSGYFYGEEVLRARPWQDTANAAAIVDERTGEKRKSGPFSMEFLTQQYFGVNIKKISNVDTKLLAITPVDEVLLYNGVDSKYHEGIWHPLWKQIQDQGLQVPYDLAVRRVPTVAISQLRGIPVNQVTVTTLSKKYQSKIDKIESEISKLSVIQQFNKKQGHVFNPYSTKDLLYVLQHMLHRREVIVIDKYTHEESFTTDDSVLSKIDHPLAGLTQELREASGTKAKYVDSLQIGSKSCVLFPDDLSHPNFNTFFAETGRLSCDQPNFQNFPKRDAETKEVRSSVEAPPGCLILSFDYGQIEMRVIAMATKDKRFCQALWEDYDVHAEWARRLALAWPDLIGGKKNINDKKIMKNFRGGIKTSWTFALVYGATLKSTCGRLGAPEHAIRPLYNLFWKEFEQIKVWQEETIAKYNEFGYVESLTGRRRRGPLSINQICNTPIQSVGTGDIVMDAMCRLSETMDPLLQAELQIHDDLTFLRVPIKKADEVAERVVGMMLAVPFEFVNVPISAEMSVGKNWGSLEEAGTFFSNKW